jgi:pimeloyl-ACP methyl ester carboxylesterase
MPTFDSAGVSIHYEIFGEGRPIVLVHGFAASLQSNWVAPGWIETLRPIRRVVALDCRGHGESGKPHDSAAYGNAMQDDVIRLMDHLGIDKADLFGYSMGGAISMGLMVRYPERFTSVILGGVGGRGPRRGPDSPVARTMLADDTASPTKRQQCSALRKDGRPCSARAGPSGLCVGHFPNARDARRKGGQNKARAGPSTIEDPVAKGLRIFAERLGNDLKALAAVNQSNRFSDLDALRDVTLPVLIVVGENDSLVGGAEPLARAIPTARLITIPDRDHLTVVPDQRFKKAVVEFLSER